MYGRRGSASASGSKRASFNGQQEAPPEKLTKKRMCRIVLPPKPRPGFFDDLYQLGFIELIAKVYFGITVMLFALSVLEYAVYGHSSPTSQPQRGPCCSRDRRYSCFINNKCVDTRPRPFNGCVGCQLSNNAGGGAVEAGSWIKKLFLGH